MGTVTGVPKFVGMLGGGAVVQAGVGPVVVAVDVGADHLPGLVEGLELGAPDQALFELAKSPAMKGAAPLSAKWSGPEEGLRGAQVLGRP
jgi:hypothetical protein